MRWEEWAPRSHFFQSGNNRRVGELQEQLSFLATVFWLCAGMTSPGMRDFRWQRHRAFCAG